MLEEMRECLPTQPDGNQKLDRMHTFRDFCNSKGNYKCGVSHMPLKPKPIQEMVDKSVPAATVSRRQSSRLPQQRSHSRWGVCHACGGRETAEIVATGSTTEVRGDVAEQTEGSVQRDLKHWLL